MDNEVKKTVLLVDDEPEILKILSEEFIDLGFMVLTASGGHEAWGVLQSVSVDLVISDIGMPNGDGIELFTKVKTLSETPKFIFVTGHGSYEREDLKASGAAELLVKPYDFSRLEAIINKVFDQNPH